MLEVFVRTTSENLLNPLRRAFYDATMARWYLEPVTVRIIKDKGIREGRLMAERMAMSDPYIFTDDDVVVHGKDWVKRGTEAILANPEYACCSTLSLIETENQAKGPEGAVIYPMHWVGAPMWIRIGILKDDLPEMDLGSECGVIHNYVASKGYKEGLIAGIRHLHLGFGFSSNPNLHGGY